MFGKQKTEEKIKKLVKAAIDRCIADGSLAISNDDVPEIITEEPREKKFGDFSVNTAMQLARAAKMNPRIIASNIVERIDEDEDISEVSIAGAGFINFRLTNKWLHDELKDVLKFGSEYGKAPLNGKSVNVEFVSANPTGPLHIGNARGGAIGDVISGILECAGWEVTREFYLNDAGNQILKFGQSLSVRYLQQLGADIPLPEDCYQGKDITALADEYISEFGDRLKDVSEQERSETLVDFGLERNIERMMKDLKDYGINYDVVYSEKTLHDSGRVKAVVEKMKDMGAVYEKDGAVWFKGTEYGLEKDEVLVRDNGIPTYYAADIAYHYNKLCERNFDWSIDVWGADHHGHVARVKKALASLGIDENRLDVILMQLVHLKKDEEYIRMSKRRGNIVTLSDLVDEVGRDATRFVFNYNKPNTHMDFDIGLAIKKSNENPVFYVQYAHARMCSILRNADISFEDADLSLLDSSEELNIIKKIASFTDEVIKAGNDLDPSKMTKYAYDLASLFHTFYNAHRVIVEDKELMKARLSLVMGTRTVLKNTLDILGVEAPEKM